METVVNEVEKVDRIIQQPVYKQKLITVERIIQEPKRIDIYKDIEVIKEYVTEVPTVVEFEVKIPKEEIVYKDVDKIIEVPVVSVRYVELERPVIQIKEVEEI